MTNLVYNRFLPDPFGIVLWFNKLEFAELAAKLPMPLPLGEVPPKGAERALSVTA